MPKKRKRTVEYGEQESSSTHSIKAQPKPLSSARPNNSNNKKGSRGVKQVALLDEDIDPKTAIRTFFLRVFFFTILTR
jgi:hypothetical protein